MTKVVYVNGNRSVGNFTAQCIVKTILATIITFIIYVSFTTIATGFLTSETGYDVLSAKTGETVYSYRYTGEEPENWKDPNLEKYNFTENGEHVYSPVRSVLDETEKTIVMAISQILGAGVWISMIYSVAWAVGDADSNKVEFGKAAKDKSKPIKVAIYSTIPYAFMYILLLATKAFGFWRGFVVIYKFLNWHCFTLNEALLPQIDGVTAMNWPNLIILAVGLLILPLIILISYQMGKKHIILREKIMYKNN